MSGNDLSNLKKVAIFKGTGVGEGGKQGTSGMGKGTEIMVSRQLTFEEVT